MAVPKVEPPSELDEKKISLLPGSLSCQTTYTLLPIAAICGILESPSVLLTLIGVPQVEPPSELHEKKISLLPGSLSCQTTYTLLPIAAICGKLDDPSVLLTLIGVPKVEPPSVLFEKRISGEPKGPSC